MNVIINAGGLNTRFDDLSVFPKILLPFKNNDSTLVNLMKNIKGEFNTVNFYLLINEKYFQQVEDFVAVNNLDIYLVKTTKTNGSFNTIKEVLGDLPKRDLFFIWSDLYLENEIFIDDDYASNDVVVFVRDGEYRFKASTEGIVQTPNGNVPGIYFLSDKTIFDHITDERDNFDLIEAIAIGANDKVIGVDIIEFTASITEFRDKKVYLDLCAQYKTQSNNRFFNTLIFSEDDVIKSANNKAYEHLITKEVGWYNLMNNFGFSKMIPKLLGTDNRSWFQIEYLKGFKPVFQHVLEAEDKSKIITNVLDNLNKLHEIKKDVEFGTVYNDLRKEFFQKVFQRVYSVRNLIVDFDDSKFNDLVNQGFKYLVDNTRVKTYSFIHGDTNGSNVMYSNNGEVKLIDPRGYFGDSQLFGLSEYDFAKVLYFCSGYDLFNNDINYIFASKDAYTSPEFIIDEEELKAIFKKYDIDYKYLKVMVGFIWINLSSYIGNNVFKINISYYHGMKMLQEALNTINAVDDISLRVSTELENFITLQRSTKDEIAKVFNITPSALNVWTSGKCDFNLSTIKQIESVINKKLLR